MSVHPLAPMLEALSVLAQEYVSAQPPIDTGAPLEDLVLSVERSIEATSATQLFVWWCACALIRDGEYTPWEIEIPEITDPEVIAKGGERMLAFGRWLKARDGSVPLLGTIVAGVLFPDRAALETWATYFEGSSLLRREAVLDQ